MTDTDTTAEQETETTFGFDASDHLAAYDQALLDAENAYQAMTEAATTKMNTAQSAVLDLLEHTDEARAVVRLLSTMSHAKRRTAQKAAADARDIMVEAAENTLDAALKEDPFTHRVVTVVKRQYGAEYAEPLLKGAPFTFESLRQLARDKRWCSDYERAMAAFVRAGALPDEMRIVTREAHWNDVPSSENPKAGQVWEARLTLPAYVRDTDRYGDAHSYYDLVNYATATEYVLMQDVEFAEKTETETAEDTVF